MKQIIKEEIQKALTEQSPPKDAEECNFPAISEWAGYKPWPRFIERNLRNGKTGKEPQAIFQIAKPDGKLFQKDVQIWDADEGKYVPGKRNWRFGEFYKAWDKMDCMIPAGFTIYRLYEIHQTGNKVSSFTSGGYWRDITELFNIDDPTLDDIEPMEVPPEDAPPKGEEGTPAGGGSGGCGPRPPLSKNWREKPMGSPEREAFRAWRKCVRGN